MKIIYPPLVEQSYTEMNRRGWHVTKDETYRQMVKAKLIDTNGTPTQYALDRGYIDSFSKKPNGDIEANNLSAFKALYPCYAPYADSHFRHTSAGWAVDAFVVRDLCNKRLNEPDITDDQRQAAYQMLDEISHWED